EATSLSAPSTARRGSSTKPVCTPLHCNRKSPNSDSENKGAGSETGTVFSRGSGFGLSPVSAPQIALTEYGGSPCRPSQAPLLLSSVQPSRHLFPFHRCWYLH